MWVTEIRMRVTSKIKLEKEKTRTKLQFHIYFNATNIQNICFVQMWNLGFLYMNPQDHELLLLLFLNLFDWLINL